ncbi:RimJ/RimL family protein N-acetyltransferase [Nocardiopsis mwathae]|uniref:RimJ/RimL family protein N-acetyltransferase n=1 Tax=Nocardiopsis mwathae TaxID=1472723 RepID=A0A7W9YDE7_9ACTN|nr:RimJ/RimL family protein N-acetyltransferase [Nocardiopsis mwathae]
MLSHQLGRNAELRPLEPWNAEELFDCVECAREHLTPWTVLAARVTDVFSARKLLQHYAARQAHDTGRYLGIWRDGALVGGALFRTFDTRSACCEVGAWLIPQAQGHGLATLALRHMLDWAFHSRGLRRSELRASPENPHGRGIAMRLGMAHQTTLRKSFLLNGIHHDTEVWAVTAENWQAQRSFCGTCPSPGP